jgi:transcriptional regulator with PAS, ATPase and Fis domain
MTNTYNCIRCSFQTNKKSIMIKHLEKKNKCKKKVGTYFLPDELIYELCLNPINNEYNEFQCKNCLKNYISKYNLNRHSKNCNKNCNKNKSNLLVKYKLFTYLDIKKYVNDFYNLTILKYFEENKIYNSFKKPWNLSHIDLLTKKLLYISNDKYSDLLRKILENDKNINIIYDKNENYGYIINDINEIELINKKTIVNKTIEKILHTFTIFKKDLEENNKIIDINLLYKEHEIIKDKYNLFLNSEIIRTKVETIILNLYNEKFHEIQENALYELNNKNLGF